MNPNASTGVVVRSRAKTKRGIQKTKQKPPIIINKRLVSVSAGTVFESPNKEKGAIDEK